MHQPWWTLQRAAFSVATGSAFGASNLATPTGCSLWREHLRAGERWEFRRGLEAWSSPAFSVTALFELEAQCGVHALWYYAERFTCRQS